MRRSLTDCANGFITSVYHQRRGYGEDRKRCEDHLDREPGPSDASGETSRTLVQVHRHRLAGAPTRAGGQKPTHRTQGYLAFLPRAVRTAAPKPAGAAMLTTL